MQKQTNMNKIEEFQYASFFLSQINSQNGWDYLPVSNYDEAKKDEEVDVYAKSKTFGNNLNLQIKIIDKTFEYESAQRRKEGLRNTEGVSTVYGRDINHMKWAKKTIAECSKQYEPKVREKMILLLCVYHGTPTDLNYAMREFAEYRESDFKAIYFINPPQIEGGGTTGFKGQLIPIKSLI